MTISPDFIRAIPKTDLHLHLDGSLRPATLIELAREHGVKLPAYDERGLRRTVFKPKYSGLTDYLKGFAYMTAVLQTGPALERAGYELALDNQAEGVRYIEVGKVAYYRIQGAEPGQWNAHVTGNGTYYFTAAASSG